MPRLIALGNNITRALDPQGPDLITDPLDVTRSTGCNRVLWHSWQCTIGCDSSGHLLVWGNVSPEAQRSIQSNKAADVAKIIGHDTPLGFLSRRNVVHAFLGGMSAREWRDVAVDGTGKAYAVDNHSIFVFESWTDFLTGRSIRDIGHPLLERAVDLTIHALESRCFVRMDTHLLEVEANSLRSVDTVDGLGMRIIEGRRNRLGVVTEAGDAFVFDPKAQEPTLVDVEDEVRFLGLGSEFDMVVTRSEVLTRGHNSFGQLGSDQAVGEWTSWRSVQIDVAAIRSLVSSRWSTIFIMR